MVVRGFGNAFCATSVVSSVASLAVILTLLTFHQMRGKLFMRVIAFISIGDFLGNIPYMVPVYTGQGTFWCDVTGYLSQTGYQSGWLWTLALSVLWHQTSTRGLSLTKWHMLALQIVCWGVPSVFSLASLSMSAYENRNSYDGFCGSYGTYQAKVYHNVWQYVLVAICFFPMIGLYLHLLYIDSHVDDKSKARSIAMAKSTLVWYPVLFLIFWMPKLILASTYAFGEHSHIFSYSFQVTIDLFTCWYTLHGVGVAIVFFYSSPLARRLWYEKYRYLMRRWLKGVHDDDNSSAQATSDIVGSNDLRFTMQSQDSQDPADIEMRESSNGGFFQRNSLQRASSVNSPHFHPHMNSSRQSHSTVHMERSSSQSVAAPVNSDALRKYPLASGTPTVNPLSAWLRNETTVASSHSIENTTNDDHHQAADGDAA